MIGVAVPAHNEEAALARCLAALQRAARHAELQAEPVMLLVVLDSCTDGSAAIARRAGVHGLAVQARNVGLARQAGAQALLAAGARWLAFTDADSEVADDWLVAQLRHQQAGADAVCGCVTVDDWSLHTAQVRSRYEAHYRAIDGHRHIHGANLGVCAQAYRRAGGFRPLACSEDVALVQDLQATGAHIAWSVTPRVRTSARRQARARGGFADFLLGLELTQPCAQPGG